MNIFKFGTNTQQEELIRIWRSKVKHLCDLTKQDCGRKLEETPPAHRHREYMRPWSNRVDHCTTVSVFGHNSRIPMLIIINYT